MLVGSLGLNSSSQAGAAGNEAISRQQYLNVLHLCRRLEHVAEAAYTRCASNPTCTRSSCQSRRKTTCTRTSSPTC